MPYDAPGERAQVTAVREIQHGQLVAVGYRRGRAAKVQQVGRFVDPSSAAYTTIAVGEDFTLFESGIVEVECSGPLAAVNVDDRVWVDPDDDVLTTSAGGNALPAGVIEEIDSTRDPAVARVNLNAWWAF